ncbi:MAG TPA: transglycosylase SLT domain-containing protein [Bryobacteraceae bacterium]|jgi:membrane-bound lytic murein transglycosylase D|nr:transglycosylase SLT domain-containing protein [Bryobacteraceae bacterium]
MRRLKPVLTGIAILSVLSTGTSYARDGRIALSGAGLTARATQPANADAPTAAPDSTNNSGVITETDIDSLPHSPETDDRLKRADTHLNAGRQMYFEGDLPGARREFDAAVDTLLNAPETAPDHRRIERRLDEICDLIYRFDVEKLGAGQTQEDAVVFDKAPIDEISHMTFPVDEKLAPKLTQELHETASGIPLELSDPVLSYVHYFSTDRGRAILLSGLRRSGRYKDMVERIFAEEGVPSELLYLAQAESGFLPRAVSNKEAVGMWQFVAGTGSIYSLSRGSGFDERLDPEKATRAAAKYLKDLHNHFGDWYLAMAAYNCGAGAVDRAVERTGYADFWELMKRHALPRETQNYVPIIVAMTIMAKNPKDYGLESVDMDTPVEYDNLPLSASTNLNLLADATMQPLSVIRDLNPSLLRQVAPAGFDVHVPKGSGTTALAALETVPSESRQAWRLHHVQAGDTLASIATSFHVSPDRIAAVNHSTDSLEAGDTLLIPAAYHDDSTRFFRVKGKRARVRLVSTSSKTPARKPATLQSASHIAAGRHVSPQVLHRKAAVRTASLQ